MSKLPKQNFTNDVLVGFETSDDAGVYRLNETTALVQTLDFFTPIADEPEIYGQIAALNSVNDVYAMGGVPLTALSIVCFPQKGDWDVLEQILRGGQLAMNRENVAVIGGHSVDDQEIKFGYSVTGIVHPDRIVTNANAKPGDLLVLTKPVGTGVISTGVKFGKASPEAVKASQKAMTTSLREASKVMQEIGANAATDITGFGLLGHAYEMANGSGTSLTINSDDVPLLPEVLELIGEKMLTRGDKNNRAYIGENISIEATVSSELQSALFDPQTAGGLLISFEAEKAYEFVRRIPEAVIIGSVGAPTEKMLLVV